MNEDYGLLNKLNKEYEIKFTELKLIRDWIGRTYAAAATDVKRYVLKLFRPQYAAEAVMSAGIMTHLRQNGVSVPEVIATRSGDMKFTFGDMTAVLYEFIDGGDVESDGRLSELGALSRQMAECMEGYSGEVPVHGKEFFIDRYVAIMRRNGYPRAGEFEKLGRRLWAQVARLPVAFCHGDFHCGNMIQRGGETVVYDFDACALCTPAYDAATVCDVTDYFSLKPENFVDGYRRTLENAREFAKGRGLSEAELSAVPACVAIRHYDIQATIIDVVGHGRPDFDFLDSQLEWLQSWTEIFM